MSQAVLCLEILEILHRNGIRHHCWRAHACTYCTYRDLLDPIMGPFRQPAHKEILDIEPGHPEESDVESTNAP
ncbi:hypothetical protein MJO28_005534 [Puccinia striiformis f. sp. tritici]|uniref:Uncharacterized protein n=1 Tax=Puccinia striiformis f. sp. tritici TaxID=168172 RepID=A0ACC0ELZ7_9BASI|nr:hypothetical protein MJO28_005534 [Puccinia striiformis f. sp. tritici]